MDQFDFNKPFTVTVTYEDDEHLRKDEIEASDIPKQDCLNVQSIYETNFEYNTTLPNERFHNNNNVTKKGQLHSENNNISNPETDLGRRDNVESVNRSITYELTRKTSIYDSEIYQHLTNGDELNKISQYKLDNISDHLVRIMLPYYAFSDQNLRRNHLKALQWDDMKISYFNLSYKTVVTLMLPRERNSIFVKKILDRTVTRAKMVYNVTFETQHVEPFYNELINWSKHKREKENNPTLQNVSKYIDRTQNKINNRKKIKKRIGNKGNKKKMKKKKINKDKHADNYIDSIRNGIKDMSSNISDRQIENKTNRSLTNSRKKYTKRSQNENNLIKENQRLAKRLEDPPQPLNFSHSTVAPIQSLNLNSNNSICIFSGGEPGKELSINISSDLLLSHLVQKKKKYNREDHVLHPSNSKPAQNQVASKNGSRQIKLVEQKLNNARCEPEPIEPAQLRCPIQTPTLPCTELPQQPHSKLPQQPFLQPPRLQYPQPSQRTCSELSQQSQQPCPQPPPQPSSQPPLQPSSQPCQLSCTEPPQHPCPKLSQQPCLQPSRLQYPQPSQRTCPELPQRPCLQSPPLQYPQPFQLPSTHPPQQPCPELPQRPCLQSPRLQYPQPFLQPCPQPLLQPTPQPFQLSCTELPQQPCPKLSQQPCSQPLPQQSPQPFQLPCTELSQQPYPKLSHQSFLQPPLLQYPQSSQLPCTKPPQQPCPKLPQRSYIKPPRLLYPQPSQRPCLELPQGSYPQPPPYPSPQPFQQPYNQLLKFPPSQPPQLPYPQLPRLPCPPPPTYSRSTHNISTSAPQTYNSNIEHSQMAQNQTQININAYSAPKHNWNLKQKYTQDQPQAAITSTSVDASTALMRHNAVTHPVVGYCDYCRKPTKKTCLKCKKISYCGKICQALHMDYMARLKTLNSIRTTLSHEVPKAHNNMRPFRIKTEQVLIR